MEVENVTIKTTNTTGLVAVWSAHLWFVTSTGERSRTETLVTLTMVVTILQRFLSFALLKLGYNLI